MAMVLSVIICTYNGASRLPRVFEALKVQQMKHLWQLILVDNNSIDNTAEVFKASVPGFPGNVTTFYLNQPMQGLSHARAKGVEMSIGDYLVFCDDDNLLEPDYLDVVFDFFSNYRDAGITGGRSEAVSKIPFPDWFDKYQGIYACGNLGEDIVNLTGKSLIWGAGLAIRKVIAEKVFDSNHPFLLTDRKGDELVSGGDDEICYRVMLCGYNLYFNPCLQLKHLIPPSRLTVEYRDQLTEGFGLQVDVLGAYKRYYDLGQSHLSTPIAFIKKMAAFIYYKVLMLQRQEAHAADFLYYLTGWGFWRTPENETVLRFGSFVKSKKNI